MGSLVRPVHMEISIRSSRSSRCTETETQGQPSDCIAMHCRVQIQVFGNDKRINIQFIYATMLHT